MDSWGPSQVNYRLGFWDEKQGHTAAPLPEHRQETWLTHPPSTPYIGLTRGRSNALSKQPQRLIQQPTPREILSLEPSSPWPSNTAVHQQRTEYAIKAEINFHPYSYFSSPPRPHPQSYFYLFLWPTRSRSHIYKTPCANVEDGWRQQPPEVCDWSVTGTCHALTTQNGWRRQNVYTAGLQYMAGDNSEAKPLSPHWQLWIQHRNNNDNNNRKVHPNYVGRRW